MAWVPLHPMGTDWLGPKAAGWMQAAGRRQDLELVGVRGVWVGCWKMGLLLQAWMSPLEPIRHTGDGVNGHGVWHSISPSIQGSRSIPRSPSASFQLAKCYHLAGAFPKFMVLEPIPGTGRAGSRENVTRRVCAVAESAAAAARGCDSGGSAARGPGGLERGQRWGQKRRVPRCVSSSAGSGR